MDRKIMRPPFPPTGGGTGKVVTIIVKVLKNLVRILKKSSKDAGETDSINENASLDNIDRITSIFSDFKEQVHIRAVKVEEAVAEEVDYYTEELHEILTDNSEKVMKYGIHTKRIERQIDKISSRVKGTIDNELSKKVSLDNAECKGIIKMIPGSKKETAMNEFLMKSVDSALDACCTEIHSCLDDIYSDVETEIVEAIDFIQLQTEHLQKSFALFEDNDYEVMVQKQIAEAYLAINICDRILELL